jgi:hypothetical protein
MKKKILSVILVLVVLGSVVGCESQAQRVSYNLSQEADNFNSVRQLTVMNCITNEILFQMTGKISIEADTADNQLEIIVEVEDGVYKKHFVGLGDNVAYVVEDVTGNDVSNYKYTLNFNPKMIVPFEVKTID